MSGYRADQPEEEFASASGPPASVVREELSRVLAHPEFQATDKLRDFLRFVVDETLAGRADQLKGFTVATAVFGRTEDFDPAHDPIVRIQAGRLRRALERYYLVAGGSDPVRIDIPKGGYVPTFVVDPPSSRSQVAASEPVIAHPGPSVAVLPLENLTGDPEQNYFAVGVVEDLVTELNRFQDLIVIPCQRALIGARAPGDVEQLGRKVGARFLLGGSLRRDERNVKVSVQLVDRASGSQIWARGYKRALEDSSLIATQEEIARSVVAAIGSEHGVIARRLSVESRRKAPSELSTYEAMLRYYTYQIAPTPEATESCFAALTAAVEREPEFGPAWSALATLHCQLYGFDAPGFGDALATAVEFARRGVALEPGSQIGRLILAYVSYVAEDLEAFHQEIETTLLLNPNSPYHVGAAGYFHVMIGEFERGIPLLDRGTQANPFHPEWFHTAYLVHFIHCGEYERALAELDAYAPLHGYWLPLVRAAVLGLLDLGHEAAAHLDEVVSVKPEIGGRARELLRRTVKVDDVVDRILDGLARAGSKSGVSR